MGLQSSSRQEWPRIVFLTFLEFLILPEDVALPFSVEQASTIQCRTAVQMKVEFSLLQ